MNYYSVSKSYQMKVCVSDPKVLFLQWEYEDTQVLSTKRSENYNTKVKCSLNWHFK